MPTCVAVLPCPFALALAVSPLATNKKQDLSRLPAMSTFGQYFKVTTYVFVLRSTSPLALTLIHPVATRAQRQP